MEVGRAKLIFVFTLATFIPGLLARHCRLRRSVAKNEQRKRRRYSPARNSTLKVGIGNDFGSTNSTNVDLDGDDFDQLSNSTRRNLRQGKKKYLGPCKVTNPIDRCWRCRRNWARNRKRLAKCALGFGRRTIGGMKGRIYVVTENSDDDVLNPKPGTLRHANVIIHGIRIHHIVATSGGSIRDSVEHYGIRTNSDGDGISIFGSSNIWIDHVSMSRCTDGLIDAIMGSTAITISNSHFTHHNDAILLGASDSFSGDELMQVTVAFNHFGQGLVQRMPRCRWGFFHVVNNDYTHWRMYAIGGSKHPTIISQGNRFIAPPELYLKQVTKRDYSPESEWKTWTWRSENDLLMNGAYFIESGQPRTERPHKKFMITAKPGTLATRMTLFAGALDCKPGRKC
ncbi:PECTATE LYASE 18-RELATED [Salix koriyanagi]|uniref:Pectate lyase n=1 Tax=Salix koriyanagi TaxID=2511006 RepID=A0A9Q0PNR7_9ROSI|nr:PECTATE LYASE 18-RELATED [Salix koriyanagi]